MGVSIVRSLPELRYHLDTQRAQGRSVATVPTMGALHAGHLSLVREATRRADVSVVSIFVNPTQFGPSEDFDRYPRDLDHDAALAERAGATVIFAPSVDEMYPEGEQTRVQVTQLSQGLCGSTRAGHFEGVATVVSKLFNAIGPGAFLFGQKDYQQWRLVERMARDLLFPVEVVGLPTVREADGLAMSSRNRYLSEDERRRAATIPRALQRALDRFRAGERRPARLIEAVETALREGSVTPEYIELRDAHDLTTVDDPSLTPPPWVIAIAALLGRTRLIDNVVLADDTENLID